MLSVHPDAHSSSTTCGAGSRVERNAKLEWQLEHVYAQLDKHKKKDSEVLMVAMLRMKTGIKVEKIREYLGLNNMEGDRQWSDIHVSILCSFC